MILDKDGKPTEEKKETKPHQFGFFEIPKDCHIKGIGGTIQSDSDYGYIPNMYGYIPKRETEKRL